LSPDDFIAAAKVPKRLRPQSFGPWSIERWTVDGLRKKLGREFTFAESLSIAHSTSRIGGNEYTMLWRVSWRTLHLGDQREVVMEDSREELRKHLPIWMNAKGSILVTGLGLGCVVRGLLTSPAVRRVSVVEIDSQILRVIGHEFAANPRVELICADALTWQFGGRRWNFAWHDLWTDGEEHLQNLHVRLIGRYGDNCERQGAWNLPRFVKRIIPGLLR
jgi:hypothetical protein